MRRKDREMSYEFGLEVIDNSQFAVLSINDEKEPETPYSLPLSVVRIDDNLFFHSARDGKKVELFKDGSPVRLVFVSKAEVPDMYSKEELADEIAEGRGHMLLSKVFTTEFASAICTGKIRKVDLEKEPELFKEAMQAICRKYTPDLMQFFEDAFEIGKGRTAVYTISIEQLTAKRKRFDDQRREMKWQRMPGDEK